MENKELIQNRQLIYQKAYEYKDDIKSTILSCIGSAGALGGGITGLIATLQAPSWILTLLGATATVTPIGWIFMGVGAVSTAAIPITTKFIKDKNKRKDAVANLKIEDCDKNFLPLLFYPSLYLIDQVSKNKETRLLELKSKIKQYIDEKEANNFINNFVQLSKEEKEKQLVYSSQKIKQKPLPYFIKESKTLCESIKNSEGNGKIEYENKTKEIFEIIANGMSITSFSMEDQLEALKNFYVYLFIKENDDMLSIPEDDKKQLFENFEYIKGMDKIPTIKKNIKAYLELFIKSEADIISLIKLKDELLRIIKENLIDTKNKYQKNDPKSYDDILDKKIEKLVSDFKNEFQSILDKEYSLLKHKEIVLLFDKIEKLHEENLILKEENYLLLNKIEKLQEEFPPKKQIFENNEKEEQGKVAKNEKNTLLEKNKNGLSILSFFLSLFSFALWIFMFI